MRRLPPRELERIVATVESDLEAFPTKDSLLEHLARLHFDARARQEAIGLEEARRHPDSARRIVETAIFERRYGVKLTEALDLGGPGDEESDQANLYVEGVLRRLGIVYQTLDRGRWLIEMFQRTIQPRFPSAQLHMVTTPGPPVDGVAYHTGLAVDALVSLYRRAWVYASPSTYEGFGLPYAEALACGTPIVATPNPGSREVLDSGRFGRLAEDGSFLHAHFF